MYTHRLMLMVGQQRNIRQPEEVGKQKNKLG
jgi:hypothetical protein